MRAAAGKRVFDVVVGSALALLATPIIVVLAVAVAWDLRAWPFFVQARIGRGGRRFAFIKLRTLPATAPRAADKYALQTVSTTRLGQLLRSTHLDELPQLWLVPFGKLSLVGPRPELPELIDRYPEDFARLRHQVRPGVTGLWQVSDAAAQMIYERPEYDLHYLRHASPRLDLWVIAVTVLRLLGLAKPQEICRAPERSSAQVLARTSPFQAADEAAL